MPLSAGTFFRNASMASSPPAEAPTPTMGQAAVTGTDVGTAGVWEAGGVARRAGGFFLGYVFGWLLHSFIASRLLIKQQRSVK
jgi:hypothetical protein